MMQKEVAEGDEDDDRCNKEQVVIRGGGEEAHQI
jgi:hypothetical protein